jgi:uncharacterized sporulation protein YeaH/YhbH (DUF444 family)
VRGIELPHFRYGDNSGGVGAGDGKEGDVVGKGKPAGKGQGGTDPGQHIMEVDLSLDELAEILAEELKLPRIEPGQASHHHHPRQIQRHSPGRARIAAAFQAVVQGSAQAPDHDRRLRSGQSGHHPAEKGHPLSQLEGSEKPAVQRRHHLHDGRFRARWAKNKKNWCAWKVFWIDTWLRKNYEGIESRYIVHDVAPRKWTSTRSITCAKTAAPKSAAPSAPAKALLDAHYSPDEWNIYLFHFSDGDNSSEADSRDCVKLLKEQLLPICNMFGYCQVASAYGSGISSTCCTSICGTTRKVLTSRVNSKDDIYDSIKTFFGKGH